MGGSGGKTRKGPADKRIFVSNLPYEMKWQEVKDLFRQEVGEVSYVELFNDESGKPVRKLDMLVSVVLNFFYIILNG